MNMRLVGSIRVHVNYVFWPYATGNATENFILNNFTSVIRGSQ